ncbi:AraC family transcriptional regulator [Dactylosporangium sucinum]|uniref:HTH-type transcriptional regulator RipA n=2 Tax=Dactylosporangium sucinum TaxID=1424081 RepID=A0A917U0L4_9ACTN|nr:AraC family transcriptional regulator [Dactylosporangium sucinum]
MVGDVTMTPGTRFDQHRHPVPQLAWAVSGVVRISTPGGVWVLPATRALWIPTGVPHAVDGGVAGGPAVFRAVYVTPPPAPDAPAGGAGALASPHDWNEPTVVAVTPLLRELATHLASRDLPADARRRAEAVLLDLLRPVHATPLPVPLPADDRALRVAQGIVAEPADGRSLDAWGRAVGASGRTLARAFAAETGLSFGRWRTNARLRAALQLLAAGTPVAVVARRVGYSTPSAFIAAFRQALGAPPGAYFDQRPAAFRPVAAGNEPLHARLAEQTRTVPERRPRR